MIKNFVTISLMLFVIIVIAIFGTALFTAQKPDSTPKTTVLTVPKTVKAVVKPVANRPTIIGPAVVATHNSANDCWAIIGNSVYNLTSYIPIHPGGPNQIIPYCGRDATTAFDTKGGRGSHSQNAQNLLNNYYVGSFGG